MHAIARHITCRRATAALVSTCCQAPQSSSLLCVPAGLPSQVPEVQALALDTTCKLAAAAGPELLRPHMAALVPAMLESLRWVGWVGG